jgi:hypothetical protein
MVVYNPAYPNPSYPKDAGLSDDEIAIRARTAAMARAQSPGELICKLDQVSSASVPGAGIAHTHSYDEFMDYRHYHVIPDGAPWMYWETYDDWAQQAPAPPITPPGLEQPRTGWQPVFSTRPKGIAFATQGLYGPYRNWTFVTEIDPSAIIRHDLGTLLRIYIVAFGPVYYCHVGPRSSKPMVATSLRQVTFGGNPIGYPNVEGVLVSDPLTDFDFRAGIHICFYLSTIGNMIGHSNNVPGWHVKSLNNYFPPQTLDKSGTGWNTADSYSLGPYLVEVFYPIRSHSDPIPLDHYTLGRPVFATPTVGV